jgi:hypothetical protein
MLLKQRQYRHVFYAVKYLTFTCGPAAVRTIICPTQDFGAADPVQDGELRVLLSSCENAKWR